MTEALAQLLAHYEAGEPLVCVLDRQPYICEFWPHQELDTYNAEYEVARYAPGYFGFATSGGGEMFAASPDGEIVFLPFIGMETKHALQITASWSAFESLLRDAL